VCLRLRDTKQGPLTLDPKSLFVLGPDRLPAVQTLAHGDFLPQHLDIPRRLDADLGIYCAC